LQNHISIEYLNN